VKNPHIPNEGNRRSAIVPKNNLTEDKVGHVQESRLLADAITGEG